LVVGSSNELSRHPFPSKQLQVPIASEEAHLPLPCIPHDASESTAYIALATFFPWRSIQRMKKKGVLAKSRGSWSSTQCTRERICIAAASWILLHF